MSDRCTMQISDDGEMICTNHRSMLDAASDTHCEFMHIEWAYAHIETLQECITAALTECDYIEDDGYFHGDALIAVARVASILRGESDE